MRPGGCCTGRRLFAGLAVALIATLACVLSFGGPWLPQRQLNRVLNAALFKARLRRNGTAGVATQPRPPPRHPGHDGRPKHLRRMAGGANVSRSGYESLGLMRPYEGDLSAPGELERMIDARAYKNELIFSIFKGADGVNGWTMNLVMNLRDLAFEHYILVGDGPAACANLRAGLVAYGETDATASLGCGWASFVSDPSPGFVRWKIGQGDLYLLFLYRCKLLGELASRSVNALSLDSDMILFYDPYPHLKGPLLGRHNLIVIAEDDDYSVNFGTVYHQNAAPGGATAWIFAEIVSRAEFFVNHTAEALSVGTFTASNMPGLILDQFMFDDCLQSAATGLLTFKHALQLFLPKASQHAWRHGRGYLQGTPFVPMNHTGPHPSPWPTCGLSPGGKLPEELALGQKLPTAMLRVPTVGWRNMTPHGVIGLGGDRFTRLPPDPSPRPPESYLGAPHWLFGCYPEFFHWGLWDEPCPQTAVGHFSAASGDENKRLGARLAHRWFPPWTRHSGLFDNATRALVLVPAANVSSSSLGASFAKTRLLGFVASLLGRKPDASKFGTGARRHSYMMQAGAWDAARCYQFPLCGERHVMHLIDLEQMAEDGGLDLTAAAARALDITALSRANPILDSTPLLPQAALATAAAGLAGWPRGAAARHDVPVAAMLAAGAERSGERVLYLTEIPVLTASGGETAAEAEAEAIGRALGFDGDCPAYKAWAERP